MRKEAQSEFFLRGCAIALWETLLQVDTYTNPGAVVDTWKASQQNYKKTKQVEDWHL